MFVKEMTNRCKEVVYKRLRLCCFASKQLGKELSLIVLQASQDSRLVINDRLRLLQIFSSNFGLIFCCAIPDKKESLLLMESDQMTINKASKMERFNHKQTVFFALCFCPFPTFISMNGRAQKSESRSLPRRLFEAHTHSQN